MGCRGFLILLCLLPAVLQANAPGRDLVEGIAFEHQRAVDGRTLLLSGTHLSRWAGVLKVSVGALWLPPDARGRDVLDAQLAKQLELHYLAAIPGQRLRDGTRELLARNWPAATLARHRGALDTIVDAFADVQAGDSYRLDYQPGGGVTLARNGRAVAHTADDAAGALLFAVWLGRAPLDDDKKRALLAFRRHAPDPGTTP